MIECKRSFVEFQRYFADQIEERRRNPGGDLVSQLVTSRIDGERPLDVPEMLDLIRVFLVAGNETTAGLIAATMLLLLDHREVLDEVAADATLIPQLLEESVRLVSPAHWQPRTVKSNDGPFAGVDIAAGSRVRLVWASANRDEGYFDRPDEFDIDRDVRAHIAYGYGTHFCLGAPLAARGTDRLHRAVRPDRSDSTRRATPRRRLHAPRHAAPAQPLADHVRCRAGRRSVTGLDEGPTVELEEVR